MDESRRGLTTAGKVAEFKETERKRYFYKDSSLSLSLSLSLALLRGIARLGYCVYVKGKGYELRLGVYNLRTCNRTANNLNLSVKYAWRISARGNSYAREDNVIRTVRVQHLDFHILYLV